MLSMFEETTVVMAREAAVAINTFMAHWNDRIPEQYHSNTFHGAKVIGLARILATPEYEGEKTTLWEAKFDRYCSRLCFQIREGVAHFAYTRAFYEEDLSGLLVTPSDNNQRPSEQLEPDQSNRC